MPRLRLRLRHIRHWHALKDSHTHIHTHTHTHNNTASYNLFLKAIQWWDGYNRNDFSELNSKLQIDRNSPTGCALHTIWPDIQAPDRHCARVWGPFPKRKWLILPWYKSWHGHSQPHEEPEEAWEGGAGAPQRTIMELLSLAANCHYPN